MVLLAAEGSENDLIECWSAVISLPLPRKAKAPVFKSAGVGRSIWHVLATTSNHSQPLIPYDYIPELSSTFRTLCQEVNTIRAPEALFAGGYPVP